MRNCGIKSSLAVFLLLFLSCMPTAYMNMRKGSPLVRVGLRDDAVRIQFSISNAVNVEGKNGVRLGRLTPASWTIELTDATPARLGWQVRVLKTTDEEKAHAKMEELRFHGYQAVLSTTGRIIEFSPAVRFNSTTYEVRVDAFFDKRSEAIALQQKMTFTQSELLAAHSGRSKGIISLRNENTGNTLQFENMIRLTGSPVTLTNIPSGADYRNRPVMTDTYPGAMEFSVNPRATVTVVNIVTIEDYLRGVLPAEMPATYPFEALKAQAVAARTKLLETMHDRRHVDDGYDICDDAHCQMYAGKRVETAITDRAVAETRGLVVVYEGKLIDAVYSACCGGHTEDAAAVWGGDYPYLHGRIDADVENPDNLRRALTTEKTVEQWVKGRPNVFCKQPDSGIKALALATEKAFRWEKHYTVTEISDILRKKTGRDLGQITGFTVLKRSVSGRIVILKISGEGSLIIESELEIRRALAEGMLMSSCFVVERTVDGFSFYGAGFGHGVGMCQNGAAGLALTGKKFHEILRYYYSGTKIISIY